MMKSRWFANVCLLVITFVWGATFTLTKGALDHVSAMAFLSVRFLVASAVLVMVVLSSKPSRRALLMTRTWKLGGLLGLMLYGAYACQTIGLVFTTPAKAGFLTGLFVVLVPILGIWVLRQAPQLRVWMGAILALFGLALLCGADLIHLAPGDLLVLSCAVFVALQMLYVDKYGRDTDPLGLATVEIVVLTMCCTVSALLTSPANTWNLEIWTRPDVLWAVVICAIPATAIAYVAQNVFQKHTTAAQAAIIFSMEPVFSWLVAWVVLGDSLSVTGTVGSLLILFSMLVADPSIRISWLTFKRDQVSENQFP
jgi:drug/metabolite transporter (DMT)-like permease